LPAGTQLSEELVLKDDGIYNISFFTSGTIDKLPWKRIGVTQIAGGRPADWFHDRYPNLAFVLNKIINEESDTQRLITALEIGGATHDVNPDEDIDVENMVLRPFSRLLEGELNIKVDQADLVSDAYDWFVERGWITPPVFTGEQFFL
jgi:hypothetical protein